MRVEVVQGDIFDQDVDAIVNPANEMMLHGGGLAAELARRAGKSIWEESGSKAPVPTGRAISTTAGNLPFKKVIHVVGPVWGAYPPDQSDDYLAMAYANAIETAVYAGVRSLAFPAISCGVFMYPPKRAAKVAIQAVKDAMYRNVAMQRVVFVIPEKDKYKAFKRALGPWWRFW